jgi:hypothetical protein
MRANFLAQRKLSLRDEEAGNAVDREVHFPVALQHRSGTDCVQVVVHHKNAQLLFMASHVARARYRRLHALRLCSTPEKATKAAWPATHYTRELARMQNCGR